MTPGWSLVLATGRPLQHELTVRARTLLVSAARMDQDTLAVVATDITERKQAEDALREADQRQHEFQGILSHELRNPPASSCRRTSREPMKGTGAPARLLAENLAEDAGCTPPPAQ